MFLLLLLIAHCSVVAVVASGALTAATFVAAFGGNIVAAGVAAVPAVFAATLNCNFVAVAVIAAVSPDTSVLYAVFCRWQSTSSIVIIGH